jgi:hypothetical protein
MRVTGLRSRILISGASYGSLRRGRRSPEGESRSDHHTFMSAPRRRQVQLSERWLQRSASDATAERVRDGSDKSFTIRLTRRHLRNGFNPIDPEQRRMDFVSAVHPVEVPFATTRTNTRPPTIAVHNFLRHAAHRRDSPVRIKRKF